jgi:phenylalanyl-tRNA synthetase alpha chain
MPISDNYDGLAYDPADITRAVRYTRYVDEERMLRSHATAMVPSALQDSLHAASQTAELLAI